MIELPEALRLADEMRAILVGRTVSRVLPPSRVHKFCWFSGNPSAYDAALSSRRVVGADGFGIYAELLFDGGLSLAVNDGVNLRFSKSGELPENYQLAIVFEDSSCLCFTVQMYGGIILHGSDYENEYYVKSKNAVSPFSDDFPEHFRRVFRESKPKLSAKAFLATEQRFPGIGNGCAQDILLKARLNPKRKLETLTDEDAERLLSALVSVACEMRSQSGRDTEKGLDGMAGGYRTMMCKNSLMTGCPICGGTVTKEAYMGGSVYYCPVCQPLIK
ncbi:MAG: endonuclease VIII [Eubacteriales bacterium]|nr:endonuclease VIII [Eubacteriales bacterium]MDD3882840.1 endonuclease VIII [Eubacteriales bacterium]MDD4512124.1 endonuclease VIII [Eubacteriales bacterium]